MTNGERVAATKTIRSLVDYTSGIRKGSVHKLHMGEVPRFDINDAALVSTTSGVTLHRHRAEATTFVISKRYSFKYNYVYANKYNIIDTIAKDFTLHETKSVMERLAMHEDDIAYAATGVKRLQKFFNDLGKAAVVVLPDETVISVTDKAFKLVVRQDIQMHLEDEPAARKMHYTLWEDIGFIYDLTGAYKA